LLEDGTLVGYVEGAEVVCAPVRLATSSTTSSNDGPCLLARAARSFRRPRGPRYARPMRLCAVVLGLALPTTAGATEAPAAELPTCSDEASTCIGLAVYAVEEEGAPVVDAEWLTRQLAVANAQFEPAGIEFEVDRRRRLPSSSAEITTRAQRDRLGRKRLHRGQVTVLIVRRLADVDEPGLINGVHWRDRADRSRRFIILSSVAHRLTLAHELGHFFGLSHSTDPESLMNTSLRAGPRPAELRFTENELATIRERRDALLRSRRLVARRRSPLRETAAPPGGS
jgi:hypothetical protein